MKVKRLKKKIVDEFVRRHGDTVKSRIQLEAKLEKKLKKNKEFKYIKDSVALATSRD
jgi:nuclear transport factor 2 (NTF2) superfamily protein